MQKINASLVQFPTKGYLCLKQRDFFLLVMGEVGPFRVLEVSLSVMALPEGQLRTSRRCAVATFCTRGRMLV